MDILFIVMIGFLVCILGIIIYIIVDNAKFKYKVEIRELAKGRKVLRHDKARALPNSDGIIFWRLKKEKNKQFKNIPNPPSQCIEIDYKGNKCLTVYRDENGSYAFAEDTTIVFDDPKAYKPFTTQQRSIYIEQLRKSKERNKKTWVDNLHIIIPAFMLLIIIIGAAVFMEDIAKPFIESKQIQLKQMEVNLEQTKIMQEIQSDVQVIKADKGLQNKGGNVPN